MITICKNIMLLYLIMKYKHTTTVFYLSNRIPRPFPLVLVDGWSSKEFLRLNSRFKIFNSIIKLLICSHTIFASSIAPSNNNFNIYRKKNRKYVLFYYIITLYPFSYFYLYNVKILYQLFGRIWTMRQIK